MHGRKSSLKWEVWVHKTGGVTPPPFIEAHLTSQESELSCRYVKMESILPLAIILVFDFWNCSDSVVFLTLHFIIYKSSQKSKLLCMVNF